jgi:hypothetical protein
MMRSASSVFAILQAMLGLYPFAPTNLLLLDRKGKATHFDVLEKRGPLHVLRQPSPWSLTAGLGERIKDVMESLIP